MKVLLQPEADLVRLGVEHSTKGGGTKCHEGECAATQLGQSGVELNKHIANIYKGHGLMDRAWPSHCAARSCIL